MRKPEYLPGEIRINARSKSGGWPNYRNVDADYSRADGFRLLPALSIFGRPICESCLYSYGFSFLQVLVFWLPLMAHLQGCESEPHIPVFFYKKNNTIRMVSHETSHNPAYPAKFLVIRASMTLVKLPGLLDVHQAPRFETRLVPMPEVFCPPSKQLHVFLVDST